MKNTHEQETLTSDQSLMASGTTNFSSDGITPSGEAATALRESLNESADFYLKHSGETSLGLDS